MPCRTLRFCPTCLLTQHAAVREHCPACRSALLPLLDENGALSREFLTARGSCCANGCRNCPYQKYIPSGDVATAKPKQCERCEASFDCRREGCWCESVRLSPATVRWLERTYIDCLCPACLAELAMV